MPLRIAAIGNSLTPNAIFLPLGFDAEKSPYSFAKFVVQFDPSKSAEPPTIIGICFASSSNVIPNAFLVAIISSLNSISDIFLSASSILKSKLYLLEELVASIFLEKFL